MLARTVEQPIHVALERQLPNMARAGFFIVKNFCSGGIVVCLRDAGNLLGISRPCKPAELRKLIADRARFPAACGYHIQMRRTVAIAHKSEHPSVRRHAREPVVLSRRKRDGIPFAIDTPNVAGGRIAFAILRRAPKIDRACIMRNLRISDGDDREQVTRDEWSLHVKPKLPRTL